MGTKCFKGFDLRLSATVSSCITDTRGGYTRFFRGKNLDQEITIKSSLRQNWYLRTEYGQTGESELATGVRISQRFLSPVH